MCIRDRDIIENLSVNKTGFIDRKFFKNSDFKRLSTNHFKDIINARVKEILDYTFNNNKGLNYYHSRIGRINLFFEDKNIHKNLKDLLRENLVLQDEKIQVESLSNNDASTLFGAAELLFKGWPNEALPFSNRKKSIISSFFERFF